MQGTSTVSNKSAKPYMWCDGMRGKLEHPKRKNRLKQERMNALVFVKYNLRHEERQVKRQEGGNL